MNSPFYNRRSFLASAGLAALTLSSVGGGVFLPATAQSFAPTETMRGGSNNCRPNVLLVDRLGNGFMVSGRVREAGTGAPLAGGCIQIWAATTLGGEREPRNHGSVLTRADGS